MRMSQHTTPPRTWRWSNSLGIAAVVAALASALPVRADEPAVPAGTEAPKPEPVDGPAATEPTLPPPEEPLADPLSDAEALLDDALAAMDQAVLALDSDDPTTAAVQSQQLAVDRLKELLEAASKSPSSNNSSPKSKKSSSSPDGADSKHGKSSDSSDPSGNGGRRSDDQNSAESSENVAGPMTSGSGVLAPGARGNSVWGHLPAREQESLLRSLSDTFLPEYEAQIRRYYEALAEKK